jgi:nucleoside-diphosphate-sugar epimerase
MNQKILITGGLGYVGSRACQEFLSRGYHVTALDLALYGNGGLLALKENSNWKGNWENKFKWINGDIRDPSCVAQALIGIDTILHLGAISNDPTGEIDDTLTRQVNFDAIGMLISLAKKNGVTRMINGSSSSVFGIKDDENVTEILEPEPLTSYSKYKMLSEWLFLAASSPDFCTVNIRPATICGVSPRQRFDLTVNKLTADAITKKVITVHGGEQRRPNVGMTDIVNLYAELIEIDPKKINGKTFNFGFENHKVIDIAKIIQQELSDLDIEIQVTENQDHRDYHISSQKILDELGYQPISSIKKEVADLRKSIEEGHFQDINDPTYYNMQSMELNRKASCYNFLSA